MFINLSLLYLFRLHIVATLDRDVHSTFQFGQVHTILQGVIRMSYLRYYCLAVTGMNLKSKIRLEELSTLFQKLKRFW